MYKFFDAREILLDGFDSKIFSIKSKNSGLLNTNRSNLKILTPGQMLKILPVSLAQLKADDNSENLSKDIRQIVYSLCQSKQITKIVYNNLIKSIQSWKFVFNYI